MFIGSPVTEDLAALTKLGKQLKKNNVAIDVISIGEHQNNNEKLVEFIQSASSNDNRYEIIVYIFSKGNLTIFLYASVAWSPSLTAFFL